MNSHKPSIANWSIIKYRNQAFERVSDELAPESPLQIQLHGTGDRAPKTVAITMRTPGRDAELALGFLFSEGILNDFSQVISAKHREGETEHDRNTLIVTITPDTIIDWNRLERHGYTSSSCGVCGKTSLKQVHAAIPFPETPGNWKIEPQVIIDAPNQLRAAQENFAKTGGIHGVGLFDRKGELLHHAEDVGRHNAMDKVIGHAFRHGYLPLEEHFVVLSGRASFELIQKAAMAGIRFAIAVGAPSTLAVSLAEDQGITLCGFVRNGGFNCYCGAERVCAT